jgi:hypothetical protein
VVKDVVGSRERDIYRMKEGRRQETSTGCRKEGGRGHVQDVFLYFIW